MLARVRKGLYAYYLNIRNPLEFDCQDMNYNNLTSQDI